MRSEEVRALLIVARIRNLTCEISGLLIHDHGRFWQYLEGPKWTVEQVFSSIERDYRHTNITIVESGEATARQFPDFEMGELDIATLPEDNPPPRRFRCALWRRQPRGKIRLRPAPHRSFFRRLIRTTGGGRARNSPYPSTTAMNSRHSPALMPELSCVTVSPFSIRRMHSSPRSDIVAPPIR